ncbi:glutamate [NMDA] receptor subunit epsilon-2 [Plakobranchus ocellatus]|uniref:Glutamate [NMDA] receptor subunit epsilon-2 n=1 Tax=Plakobranchus ocellatus TaxID=259542 RepID=A0AAV4CAB7_9GAST|nr:glutamate [NMDA] receptor subunit epsilon-2 [Plakobranchus ocellatus]
MESGNYMEESLSLERRAKTLPTFFKPLDQLEKSCFYERVIEWLRDVTSSRGLAPYPSGVGPSDPCLCVSEAYGDQTSSCQHRLHKHACPCGYPCWSIVLNSWVPTLYYFSSVHLFHMHVCQIFMSYLAQCFSGYMLHRLNFVFSLSSKQRVIRSTLLPCKAIFIEYHDKQTKEYLSTTSPHNGNSYGVSDNAASFSTSPDNDNQVRNNRQRAYKHTGSSNRSHYSWESPLLDAQRPYHQSQSCNKSLPDDLSLNTVTISSNGSQTCDRTTNSYNKITVSEERKQLGQASQRLRRFPSSSTRLLLVLLLVFTPLLASGQGMPSSPIPVSLYAILPRHFGMKNSLSREFTSTVINIRRDARFRTLNKFFLTKNYVKFGQSDSPQEILELFCKEIFSNNVVTILNINNPLGMTPRSESNKYILELASYLGIPVISWDTQFTASSEVSALQI